MKLQDAGRAVGAVDSPVRLLQNGQNMAALDGLQVGTVRVEVKCVPHGVRPRLRAALEAGSNSAPISRTSARGENHCPFDDVLQFADVPRPGVGSQCARSSPG